MTLPSGTVTFLFSDIEGSSRLWETESDAMRLALERHDALLREAIVAHRGHVVKSTGDGVMAVFEQPIDALTGAVDVQRSFDVEPWPTSRPIRIRVGIHTGQPQFRDDDYFGPTVNRTARLMDAAHGGQTVCSAPTGELTRDGLDDQILLVDLGEHRLRDLARTERVFQVVHPGLPRDFPDLRTIDTLPGNLPLQPNQFVGRESLIDQLRAQLGDSSVLTLTGPGGVGKTRVALQVAVADQPEFPDGAWFIDLSSVTDDELVATEMLSAFDWLLADGEDPIDGLRTRLRRRRMLVVLDNCEQVVGGVARVAEAIASAAANTRLLATSRERLGIAAEQVVPVPPLDTAPDGEAVRLFVSRARAARPNFDLGDSNRDAVFELCQRLDGVPLAIELAAARTRSLSPAQILARLDERFRLLTGGDRTSSGRHQTLQAAVDWSYDLLTSDEQTVLNRLSIFVGGFTLDAAEQVASDEVIDAFAILDHLEALVDKSLVSVVDTEQGRRYRLLETIREYAAKHLEAAGETSAVGERHARHFVDLAQRMASALTASTEVEPLDVLDADLGNIRAMFRWHLAHGRADLVSGVLASLEFFVVRRDHHLWACALIDECLTHSMDPQSEAIAFAAAAWFNSQGGWGSLGDDGRHAGRAAAARAGIDVPMMLLAAEANDFVMNGETARGWQHADDMADEARRRGDDGIWYRYARLNALVFRALQPPPGVDMLELVEQAYEDLEIDQHDLYGRGGWLLAKGLVLARSDLPAALETFEEMVRTASQIGTKFFVADGHFFVGMTQLALGRRAAAAASCDRALRDHQDVGLQRGVLMALSGAVAIAVQGGRLREAAQLLPGLRRARLDLDAPGSSAEQATESALGRLIDEELGDQAIERPGAPGIENTIDLALDVLDAMAHDPQLD